MATLYDVAKIAGVSPKTVSRVLNEGHLVSEQTRMLVNSAIKELDYHPNAIAASLKRQHSNVIGFVVPYGSDFVFQDQNMMEQLRGTHDVLTQEGYDIIISAPLLKKNALQEALRLLNHHSIDGVIIYPAAGITEIINEITSKNYSYVSLGICNKDQKKNFVDLNITPGAYLAAKHLIALGHRKIGLINKPGSFFMYNKDDLLNGYKKALEEASMEYNPNLVHEGDYTVEGGYTAFKNIYSSNPKLSAVICASDPMTYGVIKAITGLNLALGRDVEVIAGDNLPLTQKLFPYISTINNPSYEQGKLAGKMLMTVIKEGTDVDGVFLNTEFIVRTGPPGNENHNH